MNRVILSNKDCVQEVMSIEELRVFVSEHPSSVDIPINYDDVSDLIEFAIDIGYDIDIKGEI